MPERPPASSTPVLRRDAERNRQRILHAARSLLAERGLETSHDDIARAADVGVGTVYRRFPTKEDLLAALFEEKVEHIGALADDALEAEDPWAGLEDFLVRALEQQEKDRGWRQLMLGAKAPELSSRARGRIAPVVGELVARAHAREQLRADVTAEDVALVPVMMGALMDRAASVRPELWRRVVALLLDGLRAGDRPAGAVLPGRALTSDEVELLMRTGPSTGP